MGNHGSGVSRCGILTGLFGITGMNDQIRQLEIEAIAYADSKVPVNDRYNDIYHSIVRGKFAELIVKECAKVIDDGRFSVMECEGNSHRVSYNNGIYYALSSVKKHFGVEE
jgi:hypothetical protein